MLEELLLAGTAGTCAGILTNPLEVVKTRIQLQGELRSRGQYTVHYRNVFHGLLAITRSEGVKALQKGLVPAIGYQFLLNATRLGLFQTADNAGLMRDSQGDIQFASLVAVSLAAGPAGALVSSPLFMIKVQQQSRTGVTAIAVGHQHDSVSSVSAAVKTILQRHGVSGLWRGASGSLTRSAIGTVIQLPTIAYCKLLIQRFQVSDAAERHELLMLTSLPF